MAQRLRALADLAENPAVISSSAQTSVTAGPGGPTLSSGRQKPQAYMRCTCIHAGKTLTHIKEK